MRPLPTPATVHPPLSVYSHAVEVDPGERLLVLSGQVGMAPDGTVPADPVDQADRAFTNLEAVLAAGGMAVTDLVKLTFYLVGRRRPPRLARLRGLPPGRTPPDDDPAVRRPPGVALAARRDRGVGGRPGRPVTAGARGSRRGRARWRR